MSPPLQYLAARETVHASTERCFASDSRQHDRHHARLLPPIVPQTCLGLSRYLHPPLECELLTAQETPGYQVTATSPGIPASAGRVV